MKINSKLLKTSSQNQLNNGSHKIAHANWGKFILMVSVSVLSCHKNREFILLAIYFFHSKDIEHINF